MQGGLLLVWTRFRAGAASRYELIVTGDLVVKAVEALLDALEFFQALSRAARRGSACALHTWRRLP